MACSVAIGMIAAPGDAVPATTAPAEGASAVTAPATTATETKAPLAGQAANTTPQTAVQAGSTAPAGSTAAPSASAPGAARNPAKGGNQWLGPLIWTAVIGGVFAFLWSKGYLVKIRNYIAETQEELKKCSWPSREELKGSTVVIVITTALLGLFTVGVDWILSNLMRLIT
jgi:preprotein translocase SecE subunit